MFVKLIFVVSMKVLESRRTKKDGGRGWREEIEARRGGDGRGKEKERVGEESEDIERMCDRDEEYYTFKRKEGRAVESALAATASLSFWTPVVNSGSSFLINARIMLKHASISASLLVCVYTGKFVPFLIAQCHYCHPNQYSIEEESECKTKLCNKFFSSGPQGIEHNKKGEGN